MTIRMLLIPIMWILFGLIGFFGFARFVFRFFALASIGISLGIFVLRFGIVSLLYSKQHLLTGEILSWLFLLLALVGWIAGGMYYVRQWKTAKTDISIQTMHTGQIIQNTNQLEEPSQNKEIVSPKKDIGMSLVRCIMLVGGTFVISLLLIIGVFLLSKDQLFMLGASIVWGFLIAIFVGIAVIVEFCCGLTSGLSWTRWWILLGSSNLIPAVIVWIMSIMAPPSNYTF